MELHIAPLQGYTEADWRLAYVETYGEPDGMYTPFIRVEKGLPDRRGMRDAAATPSATPQIIFKSADEFAILTSALKAAGHTRIDLNLGCPFAPQVRKGRGAGLLLHPEVLAEVARLIAADSGCTYSVKMRPGVDDCELWRHIVPLLNDMPLAHITVHPRAAAMQYTGDVDLDTFAAMSQAISHPIIYNGDIRTPDEISRIATAFPGLKGIMAGRGLLARPSLFEEYRTGTPIGRRERLNGIGKMHDVYCRSLAQRLCGDAQLLSKLKPFWQYLEPEIGHKAYKLIHKATSITKYNTAVDTTLR